MIFVTVGSQMFQFDRLLKKIDELCEKNIIHEVFAQTGFCDYKPINFEFKNFLDREEFSNYMKKADLVITHAGTGAIMGGIKSCKKIIAIPRDAKLGEHVDDHQVQIIKEFEDMNIIEPCYDLENLEKAIYIVETKTYNYYVSNTDKIVESLEKFIDEK